MEIQKVAVYAVMVLVVIMVASGLVLSVLKPATVEAGSATKFVERATGTVSVAEPEVKITNKIGTREFTIDAILNVKFDGKEANEITVIPSALFKGARSRATELAIKSGEAKQASLQFKLASKEPQMLIRDKETEFKCSAKEMEKNYESCNSEKCSCAMQHKQKLLLKNFSFAFQALQIDPSELPFAPPYLPKVGPCILNIEVQCPSEKRVINLKTPNEGKACEEQKDEDDCSKSLKMCGTLANIRLEKTVSDENLLEKLAPGTPQCRDKSFAMNIKVGDVEKTTFEWTVGEDITFLFYEKPPPTKKELENCWQDETEECKALFIGQKTITVPVDSYVISK